MAEEAKKLTELVNTDTSIPVDVKKQLTDWLKTVADVPRRQLSDELIKNFDPRQSIQQTQSVELSRRSSPLPYVTHQHHHTHLPHRYHRPYSSRPWRSNSLTPPTAGGGGGNPYSNTTDHRNFNPKKRRSSSLTPRPSFEDHLFLSHPIMSSSSSNSDIYHLQGTGGLSSEDIVMASSIKLQPGMKEVKEWLKSLRLHKYTALLESMSYDEMLNLTEKNLEEREVTLGARGKILKSIQQVKDRPLIIKDLNEKLDSLSSKFDLFPILTELEFILLMPLKPFETQSLLDASESSSPSNVKEGNTPASSPEDIPGQLFDLLSKINSHLRGGGETMDAVTIFVCFLERCRKQDAFTLVHKQFFLSWIQKLRAVWNPPTIKRVSDLNKRRFSRESLIRRSSIRSPTQLTVGGAYTPRGPSPISHYPPAMVVTTPTPPPLPTLEISGESCGTGGRIPTINLPSEECSNYGHRKSTPDIKSPTGSIVGFNTASSNKRINYQGDVNSMSGGVVSGSASLSSSPLIPDDDDDDDSLGLMPNFVDPGLLPFQIASSSGFRSRRESAESRDSGYYLSLPDSRRNSSMSSTSSDSRRESAFSFDGSYFEGSRSSSFLLPSSATSPIYHPELRRESSSDYFSDRRESTASSVSDYYYMDLRRDSDAFPNSVPEVPNEEGGGSSLPSFVVSPSSPTLGPVPNTHSSASLSGKGANSVSSGCISDEGSTHSLIEPDLEQHMANISLSVTEQVLD